MNVIYQNKLESFINFWMLNNPLSIPIEAKQFYPTDENYFSNNISNFKVRKIFEGQSLFTDNELKLINEFK